jgi:hypothetical protein
MLVYFLPRHTVTLSEVGMTRVEAELVSLVVMSVVLGGGVIVACVLAAVWTGAAIAWLRPR